MAKGNEEIELSDMDFEDDEEMECELVCEPAEKVEPKFSTPSDKSSKLCGKNESTPNTVPDDVATSLDAEQLVPDTDFDDEDEIECQEVLESEEFPKPRHDIQSKEPERQKTKRPTESEEPRKISSPTIKKSRPEKESATLPIAEPNLKRSEKPSRLKEPAKIKPAENGPESVTPIPKAKKMPKAESKKPDAKPHKETNEPDDEEFEPELVSAPSKKPNLKLKDPENAKPRTKTPLKVKPTEGSPEPEADVTLPVPKAKKTPKAESKKPDAKPHKETDEPDDEEFEPELVSAPSKKPNLKLKDPENAKPRTKTPLKVKPTEGSPEPEADVTLPVPKAKKTPKAESKKPDVKPKKKPEEADDEEFEPEEVSVPKPKNSPKVKLMEDSPEPETDVTLTLPKKKLKDKDTDEPEEQDENFEIPELPTENESENNKNISPKRKPKKKKKSKPQWIPPPRPPPEPYEMPPEEKKLVDILKEEKIPPTKRYAKKPQHLDVLIPFEIPWENLPALQTQEGMGAFGHTRDANIKIDQGSKHLIQGDLHSETVIPLFSQAVGDNRSGMLPFGSYRRNISDVIDHHKFDESKLKESNRLIPKLMQGAIQPQNAETLFGQIRNQTPHVKYLDYMSPNCDPGSHGFVSRQFAPTSTEKAGSTIMDRRRNVIANAQGSGDDIGVFNRASESIMPLLFNVQDIYLKSGNDFGAFRPLVSESEGGYRMSLDDEIKCKLVVPYQTSPSLAT